MIFQHFDSTRQRHLFSWLCASLGIRGRTPICIFTVILVSLVVLVQAHAASFQTHQLTNTAFDNGYPVISGDIVAWEDFRNAGSVEGPSFLSVGISTFNLATQTGGFTIPNASVAGFTISAPLFQIDRPDLAISGNQIVWGSLPAVGSARGGGYAISTFNLQTNIQQVIGLGGNESSPDVSGTNVVWQDPFNSPNPLWNLHAKDLVTGNTTQVTTGFSSKYPSIDGTKIVWGDIRTGTFETHLLDLNTKIDQRLDVGLAPDISGNTVVYTKNGQIFAYSLTSGQTLQLTNTPTLEERAFVSGKWVVYSDNRNGRYQIFVYDLTTGVEFPLTDGLFDARFPQVDGNRVVWMADVSDHWQIFAADLIVDPALVVSPGPVVSTPEPNAWILLASGLAIMLLFRFVVRPDRARDHPIP